ncbi:MAG: GAF domain-containing protein [Armatimonadetes bacterium]|nr:GAF domain-containing protein [Armatimonadota bacterium]
MQHKPENAKNGDRRRVPHRPSKDALDPARLEVARIASVTPLAGSIRPEAADKDQRIQELEAEVTALRRVNAGLLTRSQVMQEVAGLLRAPMSLREVLNLVMDLVTRVMRVEASSLLLLEPSGDELRFEVAKGDKADEVKSFKLKIGEGIAGWVAQKGESLLVPDVHKDPRFRKDISESIDFPTQSIVCVPLTGREKVIGVVEVINRLDGEDFTQDDVDLLGALANQSALMIENFQLFHEAERQFAGLAALREVATSISTPMELDLHAVLQRLLDVSISVTEAERGSIFLHEEDAGELRLEVAVGFSEDRLPQRSVKLGESVTGRVAQTGIPINITEVATDPRYSGPLRDEIKTMLSVPLRRLNRTIGVLNVANKQGDETFSNEDLSLLQVFASQAVAAIENARLYQDAQRKIEELTTLVGVSSMITSELDLDQLLTTIMDLTCHVMKAEASSLMLLDEETNELTFRVALGEKGEEVKQFRVKVGEGIAGWVAENRQSLLVEDVYRDPRFKKEIAESIDFPTKSIICVPIIVKEKLIGVIEVLNRADGTFFERRDMNLLTALASEAGIALENARLYGDLRSLYLNIIEALARTIDVKDSYTHDHSRRVTSIAQEVAKELELPEEELDLIQIAGLFHDIGKLGVDENILHKAARLDEDEYDRLKHHSIIASDIVGQIKPWERVVPWIKHTHERYDGFGYPDGLAGDSIPLPSRIITIADSYDAMTSDRPYRQGFDSETALKQILEESGKQFDPVVVGAFLRAYEKGNIPVKISRGGDDLRAGDDML